MAQTKSSLEVLQSRQVVLVPDLRIEPGVIPVPVRVHRTVIALDRVTGHLEGGRQGRLGRLLEGLDAREELRLEAGDREAVLAPAGLAPARLWQVMQLEVGMKPCSVIELPNMVGVPAVAVNSLWVPLSR